MCVWILVCAGGMGVADGCNHLIHVLGWKLGFSGETMMLQPSLQPQYLVFITVMSTQWVLSVWKPMVFSVLEIYFRIYIFKNSLHVLCFNIWFTSWTFPNVCFKSAMGYHPLRDINCLGCWSGGGGLYMRTVEGTGSLSRDSLWSMEVSPGKIH